MATTTKSTPQKRVVTSRSTPQGNTERPAKESERQLSLDKASPKFRPFMEWLLSLTLSHKLAAVAVSELVRHASTFKRNGAYKGDLDKDLLADWQAELALNMGGDELDDPQDAGALGFVAALVSAGA